MNKSWTGDQVEFLRENFQTKSNKELSTILDKSISSIERKLNRLDLFRKSTSDFKFWDGENLKFLLNNYNLYSYEDLSNILGFTKKKIVRKLSELKIKKDRQSKPVPKKTKLKPKYGNIVCKICNHGLKTPRGLEIHLLKIHKEIDTEKYYLDNIGGVTECRICGGSGRFLSISKGYRDLCKNPDCIKKSYETGSPEFWINKGFSEEESKIKFKEYTEKRVSSLLEGDKKRLEENPDYYSEKSPVSKKFYLKRGFSESESRILQKCVNLDRQSKMIDIINSDPVKYASKYPTKIEYYLSRGYTEEEGNQLISERQKTFILENLIDKHGKEKGTSIYNDRQKKWLRSLHSNGNLKSGYSLVSQELFKSIDSNFTDNQFQFKLKNGEFIISKYAVDFIDHSSNKIIEFNGDIYHANPSIYNESDNPNPWNRKLTSSDIWRYDKIRNDEIKSMGYKVLVIWESDYRRDRQKCITECVDFINDI